MKNCIPPPVLLPPFRLSFPVFFFSQSDLFFFFERFDFLRRFLPDGGFRLKNVQNFGVSRISYSFRASFVFPSYESLLPPPSEIAKPRPGFSLPLVLFFFPFF